MTRLFLLSPANCSGERARLLLDKTAEFALAKRLRSGEGVPLGDVFSFLSGLYFRGKLAYAQAFSRPPSGRPGILVITPSQGLVPYDMPIQSRTLHKFGLVPIGKQSALYCRSLLRAVQKLEAGIGPRCEVILLGSIASGKYLDILTPVLGARLRVPSEFIGRGDMSRGGLMLRCVKERRELDYIHVNRRLLQRPRPSKLILVP